MWPIAGSVALAVSLLTAVPAHAADLPASKGSLVIIGGALRPDNAAVWERIVQLAGGKGSRIAVFASASANPEKAGSALVERLGKYGAKAFFVPVAVRLTGTDYQAAADNPELAAAVRAAGGAYFAGGDQARITRALRRPDGSNTLVLDALWDLYRRGGVGGGPPPPGAPPRAPPAGDPPPPRAPRRRPAPRTPAPRRRMAQPPAPPPPPACPGGVGVAGPPPPQPKSRKELKHAAQSGLEISQKILLLCHVRNSLSGRTSYCH
jgi:hypothetical protein